MTRDEEASAIALWLSRTQGERASIYIAERIGALALQNDEPGVVRWKEIAERFQSLKKRAMN